MLTAQNYCSSGLEIEVTNTNTSSEIHLARSSQGHSVIVWQAPDGDGNGIFAQRYNANGTTNGSVLSVNELTTGNQTRPSVAIDNEANFVIAWLEDSNRIEARLFDSDGTAGPDFALTLDATSVTDPSIAMDEDGDFAVVWQRTLASDQQIFSRRYNNLGQAQDPTPVLVHSAIFTDEASPQIAMDAMGDFVVVWESGSVIRSRRFDADGTPKDAQSFVVAVDTLAGNFRPDVSMDAEGDFVIVWSYGTIYGTSVYARKYLKTGLVVEQYLVSGSVANSQSWPAVDMSGAGNFVVTWDLYDPVTSDIDVFLRRYSSAGIALHTDPVQVNSLEMGIQELPQVGIDDQGDIIIAWNNRTPTSIRSKTFSCSFPHYLPEDCSTQLADSLTNVEFLDEQQNPTVAVSPTGDYAVAWESHGQQEGIFVRLFDAAGTATSGEIVVSSAITEISSLPEIAMDDAGNFAVVWQKDDGDIWARTFNSDGSAKTDEFKVNAYLTANQLNPSVAIDAEGNFAVVWQSAGQDGSSYGIFAKAYDLGGNVLKADFPVNVYTTAAQQDPKVAMTSAGDFIIAWESFFQDASGSWGIFARRFDAFFTALDANEFLVNANVTYDQRDVDVAIDEANRFVLAWTSSNQDGSSFGVYARLFGSDGTAASDEFRVNEYTLSGQKSASVAMDADGDFVVTWQSFEEDGSDYGVFAKKYQFSIPPVGSEFQVNVLFANNQQVPDVAMWPNDNYVITWQGSQPFAGDIYTKPFNCCVPEYAAASGTQLDGSISGPKVYQSAGLIESVQLLDGGEVHYDAGQTIELLPGFEVKLQTEFLADIEGCEEVE